MHIVRLIRFYWALDAMTMKNHGSKTKQYQSILFLNAEFGVCDVCYAECIEPAYLCTFYFLLFWPVLFYAFSFSLFSFGSHCICSGFNFFVYIILLLLYNGNIVYRYLFKCVRMCRFNFIGKMNDIGMFVRFACYSIRLM